MFGVLLFAGVAGARTHGTHASGDGSLGVRNAAAVISINARGGVIGHFTDGVLTVKDFNPDDNVSEVVTGAEKTRDVSPFVTKYWGKDVRFRYIGGRFAITVNSYNVNLSAIGKGSVTMDGKGTADDGTFKGSGTDWTAWQWVPLINTNNSQRIILTLGGTNTFQMTADGNENANFFMLVPTPKLSASLSGPDIVQVTLVELPFGWSANWTASWPSIGLMKSNLIATFDDGTDSVTC